MTEQEIAILEIQNGLRQYDEGLELIRYYLEPERPFALRPHIIQHLQSIAVDGIEPNAGQFRDREVRIGKSKHQPPGQHLVPNLVTEMCEYVNENLHERTAFHLAAYVMWRHNWIHPFAGGNGRTSRAISYLVLNVRLGFALPGTNTIAQQIETNRQPYFDALKSADLADREGRLDISDMEELLSNMLGAQLLSVHRQART